MNKSITIGHLYPKQMNIYGDNGNVLTVKRRLEWRGIDTNIIEINPGEIKAKLKSCDILIGGGGQDSGQEMVERDMMANKSEITAAVNDGLVTLVICGLYQLFGHSFETITGQLLSGVGVFDIETVGDSHRMIGNVVVSTKNFGQLVGFENHSGKTMLLNNQQALGDVLQGSGNNGEDGSEGALYKNAFGSYLHGPLLPKNYNFTDHLIKKALENKYGKVNLTQIDNSLERSAISVAKNLKY